MLDLKESGMNGWCSAHRDVNGFHIRGPYAEPWVWLTTCQYIWDRAKWEMSALQRNVGLCGSGCRIDIKKWIKLLSEFQTYKIKLSMCLLWYVNILISSVTFSLWRVSRNRPSVVKWSIMESLDTQVFISNFYQRRFKEAFHVRLICIFVTNIGLSQWDIQKTRKQEACQAQAAEGDSGGAGVGGGPRHCAGGHERHRKQEAGLHGRHQRCRVEYEFWHLTIWSLWSLDVA